MIAKVVRSATVLQLIITILINTLTLIDTLIEYVGNQLRPRRNDAEDGMLSCLHCLQKIFVTLI